MSNSVSKDNYEAVSQVYESDSNNNPSQHVFTQSELIDFGFPSGSQVFVRAYGASFWGNVYEDPDLKVKRVKETFKKTIFKKPLFAIRSIINIYRNRSEIRKKLRSISQPIM